MQLLFCRLQKRNYKFTWHLEMQHFPSDEDWCQGTCVESVLFSHFSYLIPFLQHTYCFYPGSSCLVIYQETHSNIGACNILTEHH